MSLLQGDARALPLADGSVQCVVTSPPYWGLRDYGLPAMDWADGWRGVLGLEPTPERYVAHLVAIFREVRRVLRADGVAWLNLGDSYFATGRGPSDLAPDRGFHTGVTRENFPLNGNYRHATLKQKDLVGIPWRVAFALQADGWYLRADIIWAKPNPMPESVTDRPTKAHEYLFLLAKAERYFYDAEAVREPLAPDSLLSGKNGRPREYSNEAGALNRWGGHTRVGGMETNPAGRNRRSVWSIATEPFSGARLLGVGPGGTGRITSPDCPVHGDQRLPVPMVPRDGPRDVSAFARNHGNGSHPDQSQQGVLFATAPRPVEGFALDSWGSPDPACAAIATPHSTESHRTGREPVTFRHETAGAAESRRTADTGPALEPVATSDRRPANNTAPDSAPDASGSGPSGQSLARSDGKCACTIIDHFATFPEALVVPCVLAGTSEAGACAACGAPWERMVESEFVKLADRRPTRKAIQPGADMADVNSHNAMGYNRTTTTGWRPTCACAVPTRPCVVLDPFGGSGTVGAVAERLGRRWIAVDLKPEYLALARRRTAQRGLPFLAAAPNGHRPAPQIEIAGSV